MKTSRLDYAEERRNNRRRGKAQEDHKATQPIFRCGEVLGFLWATHVGHIHSKDNIKRSQWCSSSLSVCLSSSGLHASRRNRYKCWWANRCALVHSLVLWTWHRQPSTSRLLHVRLSWVSRWKRTRPYKVNKISSRIIERDKWKWKLQLGVQGNVQHRQKDSSADTQSLTCSWQQLLSLANSSITAAEDEGCGASGGTGLKLVVLQRCDGPFLIICLTPGWIWGLPPLRI